MTKRWTSSSQGTTDASRSDRVKAGKRVNSVSEEDGTLKRRRKYLERDYVWCDTHGEVHEKSLTYYGAEDACDKNYARSESPFRRIFVERLKGDYPHDS